MESDLKNLKKEEMILTSSLEDFNKKFRKAFENLDKEKSVHRDLEYKSQKLSLEKDRWSWEKRELENALHRVGRKLTSISAVSVNTLDANDLERRIFKRTSKYWRGRRSYA